MAIVEEQILAYLDGSLSGADLENVRGQIARDDRAARLVHAHTRLESLYALTAEPASAPLSVQRELALKVPLLAAKLPYLAMPEEQKKRAAIGWWDSFWSSKINMLLLIVAALLAGGIWYAVQDRGLNRANENLAGQHRSGISSVIPQTNEESPASNRLQSSIVSSTSSKAVTVSSARHLSSSLRERYTVHNRINGRAHFARVNRIVANTANGSLPMLLTSSTTSTMQPIADEQAVQKTPNSNSLPPPSGELPPLALHAVLISNRPQAAPHASQAMPIPVSSSEENNSYIPIHAFVEENIRYTRISPQTNPSEFAQKANGTIWQSSLSVSSPEFGIDYEASPWIALGVRGGNSQFLQEQELIHTEPIGNYGRVSKTVDETALLDPFAPWLCAAATYVINPGARLTYEFTGAAGNIFLSGFSPTALGEAAATYTLTNALELRGSLLFQSAWVKSANPSGVASLQAGSNASASGSAIQSNTSTLYPSQSFGFSVGVTFHP